MATEQEKVLTAKEAEAEEAMTALREVRDQLRVEETRREHSDAQILSLQTALEEAKKTIENNENSRLSVACFWLIAAVLVMQLYHG